MTPISVDEMKQVELEIMDEIHRICQEHGLTYYICYGTLLGAKRHGGFIPWDDDMDIVMMRDDYEVFAGNFDRWKQVDRYSLSWYRNGTSPSAYAKVVDDSTLVSESFARDELSTGVWVDIFPLDPYDDACGTAVKRAKRWGLLRSFIVADPNVGSSEFVKLVKRVVCPVARRFDAFTCARHVDEISRTMCPRNTDQVICGAGGGWPNPYDKDMFVPVEMPFEDRVYIGTSEYDRFLTSRYGDWREPPAAEDRIMHTAQAYRLE